jgi:hypothetical protein
VEWRCYSFRIVSSLSSISLGIGYWSQKLTENRVAGLEGFFIYKADWDQAVEDAQDRNAAG